MVVPKKRSVRPTIEQARQRFEHWRKTRSTFSATSPIPEALWTLAVRVASAHGINKTALALRLNYNALKERVKAEGGARSLPPPATFIELAPSFPAGSSPCTIELENGHGAKMKIHLPHLGAADRLALSRSLWSAER